MQEESDFERYEDTTSISPENLPTTTQLPNEGARAKRDISPFNPDSVKAAIPTVNPQGTGALNGNNLSQSGQ